MNLKNLTSSLGLHRKRYSNERGNLAAIRADAHSDKLVTKKEADAIHAQERKVAAELDLINRRKAQIAKINTKVNGRPSEAFVAISPNQSARAVSKPSLIVLHSTESSNSPGIGDLRAVASWFANPKAQVSAHVIVDGEGNSCCCVTDERKAWHCASYNSVSLGVEQVGRAVQGEWPQAQLLKTASYIAYWSKKFDIPITHSTSRGVCTHKDLGLSGGGHVDPGPAYPLAHVLEMARQLS